MTKRPYASRLFLSPLVALLPVLLGCGDDNTVTEPKGSSVVTFSFQRLEPLEGGLNYQAWAVEENAGSVTGYPLGLFNLNQAGQLVTPLSGTVITGGFEAPLDAEDVFAVGLTIERSNVEVTIPSYTFLMGGPVTGGEAQMTTDFWFGIGLDLSGVQGRYVLNTPTDEDAENELSGIWFMDPFQGPSAPGLLLPGLLDGWDYEGWVVLDGQSISTGKFFIPNASDDSSRYGGTLPGPTVPGEDFLRNAPADLTFPTDLSGTQVFITMEPWQQWDVAPDEPFFLRILEAEIPSGANPNIVYAMTSLFNRLPGGTATVQ
jgi:hypothetical protein